MEIQCPKCGSHDLSSDKRGWNLATGFIGSGKIFIHCLKCGHKFRPGQDKVSAEQRKLKMQEDFKKAKGTPRFWIVIGLFLFFFIFLVRACSAQTIPDEDYIRTSATVTTMQAGSDAAEGKDSWLYYNKKELLLKVQTKIVRFEVFSISYDSEDHIWNINCYSDELIKKYPNRDSLKNITPTLRVILDYNAQVNDKKYIDVTCWFMWGGVRLGFGIDAKSEKNLIPAVKKKYAKYL